MVSDEDADPVDTAQRGERPLSNDSPASETPAAHAPRGCYEEKVVKRIE